MNLRIRGKVILVAGSSREIGRAIAAALLKEGARVYMTGRDPSSLAGAESGLWRDGEVLVLSRTVVRRGVFS